MQHKMPRILLVLVCLAASLCWQPTQAATASNLVTICTSATATLQAAKCTAWQYNVYSPTAYIESYPTVTPAETGINDPKYEYRLGSTLTPTMGVKVCPTALTPGVSFNSPQADPCPNNKLVAASTVLPINTYAAATSPAGIVVYQVNTSGVSEVAGSPFVPSPVPCYSGVVPPACAPSPSLTAVDPTGQYLYALYDLEGATIISYQMINGVPHQMSGGTGFFQGDCAGCDPVPTKLIATLQHVYADATAPPAGIYVWTVNDGAFPSSISFGVGFDYNYPAATNITPVTFVIDPQEQYLYWYASSTGGPVADTVEIFELNFATQSATLLAIEPTQGALTLGAK